MAAITTDIDIDTVRLTGIQGVAARWSISRDKAYTDSLRGKWGPPDWIVTGVKVWLADRFGGEPGSVDLTQIDRDALPPLLGQNELAICFGVVHGTVKCMRQRIRQDVRPPDPYTHIGHRPLWWAPAWDEYVRITGRTFDLARLPPQSERPGFIPYPKPG